MNTTMDTHLGQKILKETLCVCKKVFVSNCTLHSLMSLIVVLPTRENNYKVTLCFAMLDSWFGYIFWVLISETH